MSTSQSDTLTPERQQVLDLYRQNLSVRRIAQALGVSTQRIYQQLDKLVEAGLLDPRKDRRVS